MWTNLAPKAKAVIILGASSLVAGTGIFIHNISTAESIKELFLSKKYTLITDDSKWASILKDYTEHIKTKEELKINDFKGGEGPAKIEEFKKQCEKILSTKTRVASTKKLVGKALWCVSEQTVLDYLKKNKYSILKIDDFKDQKDISKWDEKIKKYLSQDNKEKLENVTLEKSKAGTIDETERKEFIKACKKLEELKHFEEKFIDTYKLASNWCAEKPNES